MLKMATKTDLTTNGCTFLWKIENCCWLNPNKSVVSPTFIADALNGTKWMLRLYVEGFHNENKIWLSLEKIADISGLHQVVVNFSLRVFINNIEFHAKTFSNILFTWIPSLDPSSAMSHATAFVTTKETYFPNDSLTVQCTIWNAGPTAVYPQQISARTILKVNRQSFEWRINEFSFLKFGQINNFKDKKISFNVTFSEGLDCEKKLIITINSVDRSLTFFSFNASIVDVGGEKENCGTHEFSADDLKKEVKCILLIHKKYIENKSRYLPNDVLTLHCEYVCYSGDIECEHCCCGMLSPKLPNEAVSSGLARLPVCLMASGPSFKETIWTPQTDSRGPLECERERDSLELHNPAVFRPNLLLEAFRNTNESNILNKESPDTPEILDDFKLMYTDGIFSDTELRTSTRAFLAHKAVLSARSPVFRRMFSNDMKEKNCGRVDITDFEADIIHRMLMYMYTDSLEDLQFGSALKLYSVADKYEISSLKNRCSAFLKKNLNPGNVCDVLILADLHNDDYLKNTVQVYIFEHDKAVFRTQEWKDFMYTHLRLAADIMYEKVYQ